MRKLLLLGLGLVVVLGCSPAPESKGFDSQEARQTLIAALDAWKAGKAATLTRRQPPIRFADEDWTAGWHLVAYELKQPEAPIRPFATVFVELRLRNREGKIVQRTAGYQITLQPKLAVLRAES